MGPKMGLRMDSQETEKGAAKGPERVLSKRISKDCFPKSCATLHRFVSRRIASHRVALHRVASHHITSFHVGHPVVRTPPLKSFRCIRSGMLSETKGHVGWHSPGTEFEHLLCPFMGCFPATFPLRTSYCPPVAIREADPSVISKTIGARTGDWICPKCRDHQFGRTSLR